LLAFPATLVDLTPPELFILAPKLNGKDANGSLVGTSSQASEAVLLEGEGVKDPVFEQAPFLDTESRQIGESGGVNFCGV